MTKYSYMSPIASYDLRYSKVGCVDLSARELAGMYCPKAYFWREGKIITSLDGEESSSRTIADVHRHLFYERIIEFVKAANPNLPVIYSEPHYERDDEFIREG